MKTRNLHIILTEMKTVLIILFLIITISSPLPILAEEPVMYGDKDLSKYKNSSDSHSTYQYEVINEQSMWERKQNILQDIKIALGSDMSIRNKCRDLQSLVNRYESLINTKSELAAFANIKLQHNYLCRRMY